MPVHSPFRVNAADVNTIKATPPSMETSHPPVVVKMVYGVDTGMMIAQRQQGYHSRPHHHDSEQFNYVLEGEIWFFIDKSGFRCVEGDFIRIPRNAVHWTWVRAEEGCTMLETHTPSLTGDPDLAGAHLLVDPSEAVDEPKGVTNIFIDYDEAREIEKRALALDPD